MNNPKLLRQQAEALKELREENAQLNSRISELNLEANRMAGYISALADQLIKIHSFLWKRDMGNEYESVADAVIQFMKDAEEERGCLQDEVARLSKRDCNATIQLVYNDGVDPWAREELKVVDVGVADNCYVVESKVLAETQEKVKEWERRCLMAEDGNAVRGNAILELEAETARQKSLIETLQLENGKLKDSLYMERKGNQDCHLVIAALQNNVKKIESILLQAVKYFDEKAEGK